MHTSPAYAEDVYVGSVSGVDYQGKRASFTCRSRAGGVTTICRKVSSRHPNPFVSPLSCRFDELDGQMWLDNVLIPRATAPASVFSAWAANTAPTGWKRLATAASTCLSNPVYWLKLGHYSLTS